MNWIDRHVFVHSKGFPINLRSSFRNSLYAFMLSGKWRAEKQRMTKIDYRNKEKADTKSRKCNRKEGKIEKEEEEEEQDCWQRERNSVAHAQIISNWRIRFLILLSLKHSPIHSYVCISISMYLYVHVYVCAVCHCGWMCMDNLVLIVLHTHTQCRK